MCQHRLEFTWLSGLIMWGIAVPSMANPDYELNTIVQETSISAKLPQPQAIELMLAPELNTKLARLNTINNSLIQYATLSTLLATKPLYEGGLFGLNGTAEHKVYLYRVHEEQERYALNFDGDGLINFDSTLPLKNMQNEPNKLRTNSNKLSPASVNGHTKNHVLSHVINLTKDAEANFVTIHKDVITLSVKELDREKTKQSAKRN